MGNRHLEIVAKGRAALLAGEVGRELPPGPGRPRWGVSMLLRPDREMLATLTAFAEQAAEVAAAEVAAVEVAAVEVAAVEVAGQGHWAHGPQLLHTSLRALAPYGDETGLEGYAAALDEAAQGLPRIEASVRTVSPHPLGIAVHVHPTGETLDLLYSRLGPALHGRGLGDFEFWTRDIWYINVVHFAAEVDVERLVGWCDARRDTEFGVTSFEAAELVRYHFDGVRMTAETIHKVSLAR